MTGRDIVLDRVRRALADVPAEAGEAPGAERPEATAGEGPATADLELSELFAQRCAEYRATVTRCGDDAAGIARALSAAAARQGVRSAAIPAGLDPAWVPAGMRTAADEPPLTVSELAAVDAAVTGSALAIALTGTIVLAGGADQGRRALTLVPDVHLCVVRAAHVVRSVPDALARLAPAIREACAITLISGPSATSDIELTRVEGVHGPRRLEVVLAG
jgi:L-lactate dehydrogenase complex protein LldG